MQTSPNVDHTYLCQCYGNPTLGLSAVASLCNTYHVVAVYTKGIFGMLKCHKFQIPIPSNDVFFVPWHTTFIDFTKIHL